MNILSLINRMRFFRMLMLAASIILGSIGQIILKYSSTISYNYQFPFNFLNIQFVSAGFLYFISLLLYASAIRDIPLSVAYPSVSLSYVLVAFLSHHIWGTQFGILEIFAFLLILSGVALLFYSSA